jgi:hypothetical protein
LRPFGSPAAGQEQDTSGEKGHADQVPWLWFLTFWVAEHAFILNFSNPPCAVHLLHPAWGMAGIAVIGRKVTAGMAENTVLGRTVVVLREGVLGLGWQRLGLVAELAELVSPTLVAFWIGLESLGRMAHQTVRPPLHWVQDGQRRHTGRFVAGTTARFVATLVDRQRELGNLSLAVAAQAGSMPLYQMQDSRRWGQRVTDLTSVVGTPLVIGRDRRLTLHPMARPAILTPDHRVGDGCGTSYQCVGRFSPAGRGMAQGTVVVAQLVGSLVAIAADIVQPPKVWPVVAGEAAHRGVTAQDLHRVHLQCCLFPGFGGGVAVFAGEGQSHIVGANVAGVAIGERSV